jgi:hypothetical protein
MSTFIRYPDSNTPVPTYATAASLPATASDGSLALTLDTDILYAFNSGSSSWVIIGGPGATLSVGAIDSQTASANGAVIASDQLIMQSASATRPGLVNNTTQTLSGNKTLNGTAYIAGQADDVQLSIKGNATQTNDIVQVFTSGLVSLLNLNNAGDLAAHGAITGSNLSGTNTGNVTLTAVGSSANANGASLSGQALTLQPATASFPGVLTAADWSTFNSKQAAGDYITALTGDVTASGPGSVAATLATVNSNVGSFGSSTAIPSFTVTGKGLITAASTNVVIAPAGTLTGTTLASNVVTTSITSLGTQAAALNMGSHKITSVTDPTAAQDAATKNYVDNVAAGINPAVAVQAATTAASDTSSLTYNNGASGVGAFFTGAVNTALTVDGYTFTAVNQRLLVKNDTQSPSGAFNGVYYVTQIQTAILPIILTRALDYDMPSDINNTGAIPVINGTVNGTTQWVITSSVTTVGTDPLTYTQFARNPADYLLKANNLSDVSTKSTSFNNLSPMTALGDVIYGGASGTGTRLAGSISATKNFLTQTGNGSISAAPAWATIVAGDVPSLAASIITSGQIATARGGTGQDFSASTGAISISSGTMAAGTLSIGNGGTGQITKAAAFDALSPMTTGGDLIYGGASGTGTRLANGTSGYVLTSNGGTAAPSWQAGAVFTTTTTASLVGGIDWTTRSTSSSFTIDTTTNDNIVLIDCSGAAKTVTLPTPANGRWLTIKDSTGSAQTNNITIARHGSEKINGTAASLVMTINNGFVTLISDGTDWFVIHQSSPVTAMVNTGTFTPNNFGTISASNFWWTRSGDRFIVEHSSFTCGTPSASAASVTLPFTMDSTKFSNTTSVQQVGTWLVIANAAFGSTNNFGPIFYDGSDTAKVYFAQASSTTAFTKANGTNISASGNIIAMNFNVPISGWGIY